MTKTRTKRRAGPNASREATRIEILAADRESLAEALRARGYDVTTSAGVTEVDALIDDPPRLVIVESVLGGGAGLEVVARLRNVFNPPELPIVVLAPGTEEGLMRGFAAGASDCLPTDVALPVLLAKCAKLTRELEPTQADETDEASGNTGLLFGRYQVESYLGEGAYGVVYAAFDTKTERHVALKVLSRAIADPESKRRFLRETYALASAKGPHLVRITDSGAEGDNLYYAMERVAGPSLRQQIERCGPATESQAIALLRGLTSALVHLHRAGLIHRDIKPANIILRDGDFADPVLVDFGLCKRPRDRAVTSPGMMLGTPGYMAPEILETEDLDHRADLFALGITILFACTGREAFPNVAGYRVLQIMASRPAPIPAQLSKGLRTVLRALTRIEPKRRLQSAAALTLELDPLAR